MFRPPATSSPDVLLANGMTAPRRRLHDPLQRGLVEDLREGSVRDWRCRLDKKTGRGTDSTHGPEEGNGRLVPGYTDFLTNPDRKHLVHTRIRRVAPFTNARTRCRFGLNTRFVLLFA